MKSLIVLIIFLVAAPAWATTYYVCDDGATCNAGDGSGWSTGNDTNNGTSKATPFKTIDYAEELVSAGDTVIVGDGTYSTRSVESVSATLWIEASGTSEAWITFKSENLHGATITGPSHTGIWIDSIDEPSYIRIEDFEITNCVIAGILSKDDTAPHARANHIYLYRLKIHNVGRAGITMREADNVTVDSCIIYDVNEYIETSYHYHGIYISDNTANWLVKNNIIYDIIYGWPLHLYSHGDGGLSGHTIVNNTMIDENAARDGCVALYSTASSTFRNNLCYQVTDAPVYTEFIRCNDANTNIIAEYNITNLSALNNSSCDGDFLDNTPNTLSADLSDEFTNHATRDYTLQSDALSIDSGTASDAPDVDIIGTVRPQNSADDVGAYETANTPSADGTMTRGSGSISSGTGTISAQ